MSTSAISEALACLLYTSIMNDMIADFPVAFFRINGQDPQGLLLGVVVRFYDVGNQLFLVARHVYNVRWKRPFHGDSAAHIHRDHSKLPLIQQLTDIFFSRSVTYSRISCFFKKIHPVDVYKRQV